MIQKLHRRRLLFSTLLLSLVGLNATVVSCVDSRIYGVSAALLLQEGPSDSSLTPGSETRVVFQAVDDDGMGVPDQKIELLLTDPSRLAIASAEGEKWRVMSTGRKLLSKGVVIDGGLEVVLTVPDRAPIGRVALIASLEGQKGAQSKTQYVSFEIVEGVGGAGGAGGVGGAAGAGGVGGAGGVAGSSGAGPDDIGGEGGTANGGGAEGGALGVAGMDSVGGGVGGNAQ